MTLSPTMRDALAHMAELERLAALRGVCSNAVLDGSGRVSKGTAKALVRRDLAEHVAHCPFGADWPELRLTERGRSAALDEKTRRHQCVHPGRSLA